LTEDVSMGKQKRSADDIRRRIEEFHSSGLTRREFCQRHRIPVTTLDYWRRTQSGQARLVEVEVAAANQRRASLSVWPTGGASKAIGAWAKPNLPA